MYVYTVCSAPKFNIKENMSSTFAFYTIPNNCVYVSTYCQMLSFHQISNVLNLAILYKHAGAAELTQSCGGTIN